jgi:fermentation-respiration switch protein FrsA (DUF1100 family)
MRTDISFDAEGVTLRGWHYRPAGDGPAPLVAMAHGWGAVKEMYLDLYAETFAAAGLAVLVYDHRCFGASDGGPRQEIDPWAQVRDMRHAITFGESLPGVDPARIGIWGTSYCGGHVLVVGAIDRRVRCVVSQGGTISGWRNTLRRNPGDGLLNLRTRFEADRRARFAGEPPTIVPLRAGYTLGGSDDDRFPPIGNDGGKWMDEMRRDRSASWRNEVTLRSLEMYAEYDPGSYIARISPTPLLVITAEQDTLTPTDEILEAYNRAHEPKRLLILPGGHYDLYGTQRPVGAKAATEWFCQHLMP